MGDLGSWSERRGAVRVPVRGVAVLHAEDGSTHGTIENLSATGLLVRMPGVPGDAVVDVELKLGVDCGWVSARTVRIERASTTGRHHRIAVVFDEPAPAIRATIDAAIAAALRAAERRPVLVIDEHPARRRELVTRLSARGMTPLAPRTPLEAIELLTRAQLHVNVALIAASFGQTTAELQGLVSDSFPWVAASDISDDLDATVERALDAWAGTDVARLSVALA